MESAETTTGICSGCRVERRLRFSGYASDGRENTVRPRAYYRACLTCGEQMLVLGDAGDAMGLVLHAIHDWKQATGYEAHVAASPALRTIDLDDLAGELLLTVWRLYGDWDPEGLSFTSYASGLLPRRIASYVRDAVGSDALYRRNGRGNLARVWPKAHATSVCISIDGASFSDERNDPAVSSHHDVAGDRGDRLAGAHGASTRDFTDDRSPDLGRILLPRGR